MTQDKKDTKRKYVVQGSDLKFNGARFAEGSEIELSGAEAAALSKQIQLKEVKNG